MSVMDLIVKLVVFTLLCLFIATFLITWMNTRHARLTDRVYSPDFDARRLMLRSQHLEEVELHLVETAEFAENLDASHGVAEVDGLDEEVILDEDASNYSI